jgi:outer membrane receptor protein involved in Fe transport
MIAPLRALSAAVAALLLAVPAAAQRPDSTARRDSSRSQRLDPVVVTAERAPASVASSAAAVTRLSAAELRALPVQTVAGALEMVPGIAVLYSDALGEAPRLTVRGFYGGGETEYVTVLLDGVPLTGLATGQMNWDMIPLAALEAIEVVRGNASAAYGDAAVGGVVNLITRRPAGEGSWRSWRVEGGERGTLRAGGAFGGALGGHAGSLFGDVRRLDGWRAHEDRSSHTVGGSIELLHRARGTLALSGLEHQRRYDDPGPLTEEEIAVAPDAASPFFRFDRTDDHVSRVTLDGTARGRGRTRLSGYVSGERVATEGVRTEPLSVGYADAQDRELRTRRLVGSLQLETGGTLFGIAHRLVLGSDLSAGRLTSSYRPVVTGDSAAFADASGAAGEVNARGRGTRHLVAGFANWELTPVEPLRLTLGGRFDRIADRFDPLAPSGADAHRDLHTAWSPRVGASLRYVNAATQTGHVYLSAGRSFKAPTMDQLFDLRAIPIPFPPFSVTTSNPELDPQYGKSVEAGIYHLATLVPDALRARLALSVYRTDMRDELDFDLQSFRYVNIGRSRHKGVEAGLTLDGPASSTAFANYTRQDATSTYGDNQGKQLKSVPRDIWVAGLAHAPRTGLGVGVTATTVSNTWLDDANARRLPQYTRVDLEGSYALRGVRLVATARNLFDRRYSTTGFPDPGGSDALLLYPAAGRVITVGLASSVR